LIIALTRAWIFSSEQNSLSGRRCSADELFKRLIGRCKHFEPEDLKAER
jgi:hypothetical protein